MILYRTLFILPFFMLKSYGDSVPLVVTTWPFVEATQSAWNELSRGGNGLDALVVGGSKCEELQCDGTVGYGGSPDEKGETTLDAMIFDGSTLNMGAVAGLRRIKNAISVARHVLHNTKHSLLVGDLATQFAIDMGFEEISLSTEKSLSMWKKWIKNKCQPNFWINVEPDPEAFCGPYHPISENSVSYQLNTLGGYNETNHDTISMIVIDSQNNIVAGTSTNGAIHKIPGRVGDSPIPGAGAYADNSVGAAVATGDGDVMMRFLPSFLAVEEMRRGKTPKQAAEIAIARITSKYPTFFGAVVAVNSVGEYAAACNGMQEFVFCVANEDMDGVTLERVKC